MRASPSLTFHTELLKENPMQAVHTMSRLGLGTGRLASLGSKLTAAQRTTLIHTALDNGIRVLDTADTYASGDSERSIAMALKDRHRDDCFLITKAGFSHVALPAMLSPLNQIGKKFVQKLAPGRNFRKAYLLRAIERSLKRLGTDHVDAFLLHAAVAGEPTSETWEALEQIRTKGMSRATGLSSSDPHLVQEGLSTGQVSIVETPVSLVAPSAAAILELCAARNIPVVANEVLKPQALLKIRANDWNALQTSRGLTSDSTVNLLIAFAAAQLAVVTTLVGTTSAEHLINNLGALPFISSQSSLFSEMKATFL